MKPLRISSAILMFCILIIEPVEKARGEVPTSYTWQMERMSEGSNGGLIPQFRPGDLVVSYQDVPLYLFPLGVQRIQVACAVTPGRYHDSLRVVPIIYDGAGNARYVGNKEVALRPWGFNEIALTEMHDLW